MAWPNTLDLPAQGLNPAVEVHVAADGYDKGEDENGTVWRRVKYRVFDLEDIEAGHKSDLVMDALMGRGQQETATNFTISNFRAAHRYPGNVALACVSTHGRHIGVAKPDATKMVETNCVEIDALYRSLPFITEAVDPFTGLPVTLPYDGGIASLGGTPMPYVSIEKETSPMEYTIPQASLISDDDVNSTFARGFRKRITLTTYRLTYHGVPFLGDHWDDALTDSVNNATIFGKLAETMRYDGSRASPTNIGAGVPGYDVTVQVTHNPMGWNTELPVGKNARERVVFEDDTTKTPYRLEDFSILIIPT